ncbi:MAG TPA: ATP-binding protein [Actinomycetota bacterium]|nr:ATP-binding protein [Actinomycetota bacterium]
MTDSDSRLSRLASLAHPDIVLALGISVLVTIGAVATPVIHFAYRNPSLHIAFETADALIASFAAFLLFGRYRQSKRVADLGLVFTLDLLALTNIAFSVIPTVLLEARFDIHYSWGPAILRLIAAAALLLCARVDPENRTPVVRSAAVPFAAAALLTAIAAVLSVALSSHLPDPLHSAVITQTVDMLLTGDPAFMAIQALSIVFVGLAAVGFARRGVEHQDDLMFAVAAACVFLSFGRLNLLLFPSLYTDYVYTGDLLRFAFYVMLVIGGVREIRSYWASRAQAAVADERRRFARDLHDGAAQELLFILAQTRRLAKGKGSPRDLEALESAADRAVFESRRAIHALALDADHSLTDALREARDELSRRWGREIELEMDEANTPARTTEQLVRVMREAVTNAIKHASPSVIRVGLKKEMRGDRRLLTLEVEDDGVGFESHDGGDGFHFGMTSMRERATSIGGDLEISSRPGGGSCVRLTIEQPS